MEEAKTGWFISLIIVFYLLIALVWRSYESIMLGEITPTVFDSVFALILASSMSLNVMLIYNKRF